MDTPAEVRTIVGGQHLLTQENWALSLVRKLEADHAYLILEGVDDDQSRFCMDAHLVIKKGSDGKKADIVNRGLTPHQVKEVGDACHSYTWQISKAKAEQLIGWVKEQKAKADRDEINYVLAGKTKLNTFFNKSLINESNESVENHSRNVSVDALLVKGHSCCSWAIEMITKLGLPTPTSFAPFFACIPKNIVQGTNNGDALQEEPTTKCRIM